MSQLNKTPSANRLHIGLFGKRNAGKSSLMNALLGQNLSIISKVKGTTTDPVQKAMEIAPLGPVVLIDTPGFDDDNPELGQLRVNKALQTIGKTDIALLVIAENLGTEDEELIELFGLKQIPFIVVMNKIDAYSYPREMIHRLWEKGIPTVSISAQKHQYIDELVAKIIQHSPTEFEAPSILGDLIRPSDIVLLIMPIDKGMPKGRLILPQVQTMRDILDNNAIIISCKDTEIQMALDSFQKPPALVVTDSQIFEKVSTIVPKSVPLTSFSILFARLKGDLQLQYEGAKKLQYLKPHDKVLIAEACTHVQQDQDIASVKIPQWVHSKIDPTIQFEFSNGTEFPLDLEQYSLVIHCGGCMINRREMQNRLHLVKAKNVPITNYGLAIASMMGILDRAMASLTKVKTAQDNPNIH